MMSEFDLNGDGLDFAELYRASGGNSEDLWFYIQIKHKYIQLIVVYGDEQVIFYSSLYIWNG